MQRDYQGQNIVIVGAGTTGRSLARFFRARGATVSLSDSSALKCLSSPHEVQSLGVHLDLGGHTEEVFSRADLVVVSPGVPLDIPVLNSCRRTGVEILGEVEVASRELSGTMIGITGTNGKSTVTTLIGEMLKVWEKKVFVGGNLGTPLINAVKQECDWQVVELSSFQLESIVSYRPDFALLLNISEDHLDRYPDMASYLAAKARIFQNQGVADTAVLNADDPLVMQIAERINSHKIFFSSQSVLEQGMSLVGDQMLWSWQGKKEFFPLSELQMRGQHNQENVMAAMIPLLIKGCPAELVWSVVSSFTGLPHRMEFIGELHGSRWYNDSKGTNIGSVVKSLSGLTTPVVLVAGGKDKQGDLSALTEPIGEYVDHLVLIGAAAERMAGAFAGHTEIHRAGSMREAVELAEKYSCPGGSVLLSPGCSSFDMYKDYMQRGDDFTKEFRVLSTKGQCVNGG